MLRSVSKWVIAGILSWLIIVSVIYLTVDADTEPQQATHTALSRAEQIALMQECVTDGRAVASDWRLYKDAAGTVNAVLAAAFFEYRTR